MICEGVITSTGNEDLDGVGVRDCSRCGTIRLDPNGPKDSHRLDTELKVVYHGDKKERLFNQLTSLRSLLIFTAETSNSPTKWGEKLPSTGHCAVAAILVQYIFGGELVSIIHEGHSHWFNKIGDMYADITGDQYGWPAVQVDEKLYLEYSKRARFSTDITEETNERVRRLVQISFRGTF